MPASAVGGSVARSSIRTAIGVGRVNRALAVARVTRHAASTRSPITSARIVSAPEAEHQRIELDAAVQLGGARDPDRHQSGDRDGDDERKQRCGSPDVQAAGGGEPVQLTAFHAQGVQDIVVTRLCVRLAKESLGDDEEQRDEHEERDETKRDGLRPNRGFDLRLLQFPAHDEARRPTLGESFNAFGERVQQLRCLQVHVHDRVQHDVVAVATGELGREVQRRREVGSERRKLERRRFDARDPQRDIGPGREGVDRGAARAGSPARRLPKLLRSCSAVVSNPDA